MATAPLVGERAICHARAAELPGCGGFAILELPLTMRARFFLCITVLVLCHPQLWPQAVTKQLPLSNDGAAASVRPPASATNPVSKEPTTTDLPDDPSMVSDVPVARIVPAPQTGVPVM